MQKQNKSKNFIKYAKIGREERKKAESRGEPTYGWIKDLIEDKAYFFSEYGIKTPTKKMEDKSVPIDIDMETGYMYGCCNGKIENEDYRS